MVKIEKDGCAAMTGEIGELIVKGPGVMEGYYKDPQATNNVLANGWLRTGDLAYVDEEGYIYIVGRKKDVIISGGENIYPIQIENHIRKLPGIKDVAVLGYSNRRMGELVAAVIEVEDNTIYTKTQLSEYCSNLPIFQRPSKYIFAKIIRNSLGKPDKLKMKKIYIEK